MCLGVFLRSLLGLFLLFSTVCLQAAGDPVCAICGKVITGSTVYTSVDQITGEKVLVCEQCVRTPNCYLCGLPVGSKGTVLPDGRSLCARDSQTVVLDTNQIVQVCGQINDNLNRTFSRFMTIPASVQVVCIDRLSVRAMYVVDGYDIESPNVLGWCRPVTNTTSKSYVIGLMTAMPLAELKAVCAHELGHAWAGDNIPPARRQDLVRDTEEGFCEMLAYLLMDKQGEEGQKKSILRNLYTRGQVDLFIEAEKRYGLNEILDWMKYGSTRQLVEGHLDEIRNINLPPKPLATSPPKIFTKAVTGGASNPPTVPKSNTLKLDGILWSKTPLAIINGRTFGVNDTDKVPLGNAKVAIRCLAIEPDSVRIQQVDSGTETQLHLQAK